MSFLETLSEVLSKMLFASHEFFCGFGDSKRFVISNITSVGMGSDLLWFLLMHDSKLHCRYTWQKPSESATTIDHFIQPKDQHLKGIMMVLHIIAHKKWLIFKKGPKMFKLIACHPDRHGFSLCKWSKNIIFNFEVIDFTKLAQTYLPPIALPLSFKSIPV